METIDNGVTIVSSQLNRLKNQLNLSLSLWVLAKVWHAFSRLRGSHSQDKSWNFYWPEGEILTRGSHSRKTNEGAGKNLPETKKSRKQCEKSFLKASFLYMLWTCCSVKSFVFVFFPFGNATWLTGSSSLTRDWTQATVAKASSPNPQTAKEFLVRVLKKREREKKKYPLAALLLIKHNFPKPSCPKRSILQQLIRFWNIIKSYSDCFLVTWVHCVVGSRP